MARRDEQLLGEIAVREGLLSLDQIEECVRLQEKEDAYRPLGALLIEKGYLEPGQLHTILEIQQQSAFQHERLERKRENDRIFSKICLSRGLVTFEQVNECLKVQTRKQKKGVFIPLSRLLLQKGHLSSEQVREVYKIQYGVVFYCPACQVSYQIPEYSQEKSYECPKCAGALVVQDAHAPVSGAEGGLEDSGYDPVLRPAKSETKLGNYRILRELGRGAMGLVYLAQDDLWKRRVALKILPGAAGLQADTVERFKREAKAAKDLDHPGIIPIYDVGEHRGTHYFAMKYVEGTSLDHMIDREGIEPEAACRMIVQAAEALEHAHANGVVHRDIKPENLIHEEASGRVIVTDFGLAKPENSATLTASEAIVGTPCYMSPEQARGKRSLVDHRTDIYSLGATLYELLTYQLPFEGEDVQDILRQVVEENPEPPRRINPKIPRDLEAIVLKAIAKNPKRRYQSMREFAADLKLFLRGRKVRAKPLHLGVRVFRFLYRHREVVVLFLLVQTLILTGGLFLLYSVRQNEYREIIRQEREDRGRLEGEVERLEGELARGRGRAAPLPTLHPGDVGGLAAATLLAWCREALLEGREEAAWAFWDRARALDPAAWEPWLLRGEHRLRTGEIAGAMEDLRRASRAAPDETRIRRELARAYLESGRIEQALAEADRVLDAVPGDPVALSVRVRAFLRSGPADEAEEANAAFDRETAACRRLDAGERLDRFYLERVRLEGARDKEGGAWADLALAVDGLEGPGWQQALLRADAALVALGEPVGAEDSTREARAWIELARARALLRTDDARRVLDAIERGLTIDPQAPHLLAEHAWVLWKSDPSGARIEERALGELHAAAATAPGFVLAHARLAEILLASGRVGDARKEVEALAGLAPDHPDLARLRRELGE